MITVFARIAYYTWFEWAAIGAGVLSAVLGVVAVLIVIVRFARNCRHVRGLTPGSSCCANCRYNLRGIGRMKCPECGATLKRESVIIRVEPRPWRWPSDLLIWTALAPGIMFVIYFSIVSVWPKTKIAYWSGEITYVASKSSETVYVTARLSAKQLVNRQPLEFQNIRIEFLGDIDHTIPSGIVVSLKDSVIIDPLVEGDQRAFNADGFLDFLIVHNAMSGFDADRRAFAEHLVRMVELGRVGVGDELDQSGPPLDNTLGSPSKWEVYFISYDSDVYARSPESAESTGKTIGVIIGFVLWALGARRINKRRRHVAFQYHQRVENAYAVFNKGVEASAAQRQ